MLVGFASRTLECMLFRGTFNTVERCTQDRYHIIRPKHGNPSSTTSMLPCIKPHQRLCTHPIALPQQTRDIHIQRTIRLRVRQQLMDGSERLRDRVGGRPRCFEEVETDLPGLRGERWVSWFKAGEGLAGKQAKRNGGGGRVEWICTLKCTLG